MGSEGSTGVELDLEKSGVDPEVPTTVKPVGSEEEGSTTLGCASAGAGVCASVGYCSSTLMILRSIRH